MRLVCVAAALLVANATAVLVLCGAIDAVWQDQAAVAGNYPECESYYDNSNLDQTVDIDSNHPHMGRFNACKRYGATTWTCPALGEHDVEDGAESEQPDEENHQHLMARRFRKSSASKVPGIERRDVTDDTEPEQADKVSRESTRAARLCKRTFTDAHWGCPGAGKRDVQGIKGNHDNWPPRKREGLGLDVASKPPGNWPPHKRETLAVSNVDANVGLGTDVASSHPGNWPPHTREGLGLDVASKPPGNWPPHKRETLAVSNVDANVGLGTDVVSSHPGNWPPHKRLDVADDE